MSEWKMVPVEPTTGVLAGMALTDRHDWGLLTERQKNIIMSQMRQLYRAMLDAAPAAPADELARLRAENERLKADAERYLFLCGGGCPFAETDSAWGSKAALDAAIDAERLAERQAQEE